VLIGVRVDGRKELVALADGYRESTESWSDLLRDCKRRGMRAPVAKITDDIDELLAFYDYPAEHWIHLRTTKHVERPDDQTSPTAP
jgi:transposase-like protein